MDKILFSPKEMDEAVKEAIQCAESESWEITEDDKKNTITFLQHARDKISHPDSWSKGFYAKDVNGNKIYPGDPDATSWCLLRTMMCNLLYMKSMRDGNKHNLEKYDCLGRCILGNIANIYCEKVGRKIKHDYDGGYGTKLCLHGIPDINDHEDTTHTEIMMFFNAAICALESKKLF